MTPTELKAWFPREHPGWNWDNRLAGASIKVYVDGVLAGSTTETDLQTETRHGIGSIAASSAAPVVLWDDVSFTIPGS